MLAIILSVARRGEYNNKLTVPLTFLSSGKRSYYDKDLPPPPVEEALGEEGEEDYYGGQYDYDFVNYLSAEPTGYSSSKRALSTISERTEDSRTTWTPRQRSMNRLAPSTASMSSYGQVQERRTFGIEPGRMSPASGYTQSSARTGMASIRTGTTSYGQLIGECVL